MVRIRRSHRRGRGSIPRTGGPNFLCRTTISKYVLSPQAPLSVLSHFDTGHASGTLRRLGLVCSKPRSGRRLFVSLAIRFFCPGDGGYWSHRECRRDMLPWRNWLARSAVNRKVGGSSPPGSVSRILRSRRVRKTNPSSRSGGQADEFRQLNLMNSASLDVPMCPGVLVHAHCSVLQLVTAVGPVACSNPLLSPRETTIKCITCRDQDSNLGYCGHNAMY